VSGGYDVVTDYDNLVSEARQRVGRDPGAAGTLAWMAGTLSIRAGRHANAFDPVEEHGLSDRWADGRTHAEADWRLKRSPMPDVEDITEGLPKGWAPSVGATHAARSHPEPEERER